MGKNLTPGAFALYLRKKIKRVGITVQHQGTQIEFAIGVFATVTLLPTSVLTHDSLPASDAGSDVCSLVVFVVSVITTLRIPNLMHALILLWIGLMLSMLHLDLKMAHFMLEQ